MKRLLAPILMVFMFVGWVSAQPSYLIYTGTPPEPVTTTLTTGQVASAPAFLAKCKNGSIIADCDFSGEGGGVTKLLAGTNISLSPSGGTGDVTISSTGGGGGFNPILPSGGNFISAGDSLCTGHGLSTGQDWPTLLGALPVFTGVTVTNTCVDGESLSGMTSLYTSTVHPHTFAVTGKACIVAISIYGNDIALISSEGIAAYEASYATYVGMAHTDGCKVMFMEQWAQTGRQAEDVLRLQFNEYNRVGGSDYFLSTVGRMNDPANTEMYQGDGLHETLIGSTYIATQAQVAINGGGQGFSQGNTAFENPLQFYPILVNNPGGDAATIRNTANTGADSWLFIDDAGAVQSRVGWLNTGFSTSGISPTPGQGLLINSAGNLPIQMAVNGVGMFNVTGVSFGCWISNSNCVQDAYNGGGATTQMGTYAASGYNYRMSTADQSGAKITLGYQSGNGYGNTRTYTDLLIANHAGTVTNGNASFSVDQSGNMGTASVTVNGGSNIVYVCSGGTFAGLLATSSAACTGGTGAATHLTID